MANLVEPPPIRPARDDLVALPPIRPITMAYLASLSAVAGAVFLLLLDWTARPTGEELALAVALGAAVTAACLLPLNVGHRREEYLDTAVILAAILVLDPAMAMFLAGAGSLVATIIRRRTWPERVFNSANTALQAGVGSLVLLAIGWDVTQPRFDPVLAVSATLLAGATIFLINSLALSAVISYEERQPLLSTWFDNTLGVERPELLAFVAQMGIGLLAAVVMHAAPWALVLLFIPVIAIYKALEQHVALRRRAEANLAAAQQVAHLGSLDWDLPKNHQRWSDALFALLGLDPATTAPTEASYLSVVHPDDRAAVAHALENARLGVAYAIDHRIVRPDGEERFIHSRGEVVRGRDGRPRRVVGTLHDITERKRLEDRLAHQAYHDPLTDLPNRTLFTNRLDQALAQAGGRPPAIAVLFLDLDRFKLINDTLGHEAGDQLLIAVAARLLACTRPADTVARLGGDEFTVLLHDVRNDAEAERVALRIIAAITEPITLPGSREVVVSTSIGIVRPGPEHRSGTDLLRDADTALYRAKDGGRNRYAFFDASMGEAARERVALEADLRRALERAELCIRYQPKLDLATGQIVSVEALVRWHQPSRGWVPPAVFIPIAEETGLIGPIGRWILETACREAAAWTAITPAPPVLSVNLSGKQLHDPALVGDLERTLHASGLEPRRLRLEISEAAAMQNADAAIATLERLHRIGVRVVIDDFGTGSASLSALRRFPVDTLQLDHSFVAELGRDIEATTVAQAVIGLAHGLGLKVVAEGVERPEQLAQLRTLGCEQAQGNLFAPPLEASALAAYLTCRAATVSLPPSGESASDATLTVD